MEIRKLNLLQMGHQRKTKERILPTSNLANQWVYYHCLQQHEWLSGNFITKTAHPSTAMTQGRYIPGALMHTYTHHPHPLLSYSTKERIYSPASFVKCLHNYGKRSWKARNFFFLLPEPPNIYELPEPSKFPKLPEPYTPSSSLQKRMTQLSGNNYTERL